MCDVSRESARHRSLSLGAVGQALPHGYAGGGQAFDAGRCQRGARLAYSRRTCPAPDRASPQALCGRQRGPRIGEHGVRAGFDHHRPVSVALSLGAVSHHQVRRENAYAAGLARQHSQLHPHLRRQAGRRQCARHPDAGARAIYVMDRGYLDFARLYALHQAQAFFITRTKSNTRLRRVYSAQVDRHTGIICDQTVALTGTTSRTDYPGHLRRIRYKDAETGKTLAFLTNSFVLPATTICALYKAAGRSNCFSNGSSSIFVSRSSTAIPRMR